MEKSDTADSPGSAMAIACASSFALGVSFFLLAILVAIDVPSLVSDFEVIGGIFGVLSLVCGVLHVIGGPDAR
jgi:hypothetical protein